MAAAAAVSKKQKDQTELSLVGTKEEDSVPPVGGGIAAMAAVAVLEKQSSVPQGDTGSAPIGGIAAMAAAVAASKIHKFQVESLEAFNVGERTPLNGGGSAAVSAATTIKNQKNCSQKDQGSTHTDQACPEKIAGGRMISIEKLASSESYLSSLGTNFEFLAQFNNEERGLSALDIADAMIAVAFSFITSHPRSVPALLCLHEIFATRFWFSEMESDREYATKALLRGLDVAFHACAVGMIGWVEYGSCDPLERSPERPLVIMGNLAAFHGSLGDWKSAVDVMESLVLRSEQQFPLYHPITLTSILDLAACLFNCDMKDQATKYVQRVSQRLSHYLGEQEQAYFVCNAENNVDPIGRECQHNNRQEPFALDHLEMLRAFSSTMRRMQGRKIAQVLGSSHPMSLLFHCFLGDTLSVLANCISSSRNVQNEYDIWPFSTFRTKRDEILDNTCFIWEIAGNHYRTAMKGWVKLQGLHHPNIPVAAYGMARCLRELGRRDEALKILSSVVRSRKHKEIDSEVMSPDADFMVSISKPTSFGGCQNSVSKGLKLSYDQSIALCLWSMAVYVIEEHPDEGGQIRALDLLRASSETLSHGEKQNSELLYIIKNEERRLLSNGTSLKEEREGYEGYFIESFERHVGKKESKINWGDADTDVVGLKAGILAKKQRNNLTFHTRGGDETVANAADPTLKRPINDETRGGKVRVKASEDGIVAMAAVTVLKKQKHQVESSAEINREESAPPAEDIATVVADAALKRQNTHSQKDTGSGPMGIVTIATAATLPKKKNQSQVPEETSEKERIPSSGSGIAAMAVAAALKKRNLKSQEGDSSAPVGGIAAMAAAAAFRKQENQLESQAGYNAEESAPPAGRGIAAMAAAAALNKQNIFFQREQGNAQAGGIASMAAAEALEKQKNQVESEQDSDPVSLNTASETRDQDESLYFSSRLREELYGQLSSSVTKPDNIDKAPFDETKGNSILTRTSIDGAPSSAEGRGSHLGGNVSSCEEKFSAALAQMKEDFHASLSPAKFVP